MNRLHGGKRLQWTRFKKWSAGLAGAVVAAIFVVLLAQPQITHAVAGDQDGASATVTWLNRYYIKVNNDNYKDENPFDNVYEYTQQTTNSCKNFVKFYPQPLSATNRLPQLGDFLVNSNFFFRDNAYNNQNAFRGFFVPKKVVTNSANQQVCVSVASGKADDAGYPTVPLNPENRRITFYRSTGDNKIHNIGSGITFSQVTPTDVAVGRYPRYFRDDERTDRNNSCPDMIVLHAANSRLRSGLFDNGTVPGSSILFSVQSNSDLSRISETYLIDSGLGATSTTSCRVRSSALDRKQTGELSQYSSGENSDDQYFMSTGLDDNGQTSDGPDGNYKDDAFIIFIGDESNMPHDTTGAVVGGAADPSQAGGDSDLTDETVCRGEGLGWLVCPIVSAVQGITDLIRDGLQYFLSVNPLPIGNGPIYQAWNNIRNIANIAFVIGFMAIIFSQATSIGISNYGIKRLLPRLILVVVATNISYFICSFAIDLFNILGVGMTTLISVVNGGTAGTIQVDNSQGAIFTGGLAAAIAWAIATGAIVEVFPLLAAAALALLVTFLVLVARQAIIILLVVFSPLAFVAGLLPGTQQWLTRWSNLFIGLLVMYPMVMALFAIGRMISAILSAAGS